MAKPLPSARSAASSARTVAGYLPGLRHGQEKRRHQAPTGLHVPARCLSGKSPNSPKPRFCRPHVRHGEPPGSDVPILGATRPKWTPPATCPCLAHLLEPVPGLGFPPAPPAWAPAPGRAQSRRGSQGQAAFRGGDRRAVGGRHHVLASTHYTDEAERCHYLAYMTYGQLLLNVRFHSERRSALGRSRPVAPRPTEGASTMQFCKLTSSSFLTMIRA